MSASVVEHARPFESVYIVSWSVTACAVSIAPVPAVPPPGHVPPVAAFADG